VPIFVYSESAYTSLCHEGFTLRPVQPVSDSLATPSASAVLFNAVAMRRVPFERSTFACSRIGRTACGPSSIELSRGVLAPAATFVILMSLATRSTCDTRQSSG